MDVIPVVVPAPIPADGAGDQVIPQVGDASIKRRRLSAKVAVPSLPPPPPRPPIVAPPIRHRRLREKGPAPLLLPPPPRPAAAVLPLNSELWNDISAEVFRDLTHRRKYRMIYNKFDYWFFGGAGWVGGFNGCCSQELWNLGQSDYGSLSKHQKNCLIRHFLHFTNAPNDVLQFARRQWPVDASELKPKLVLHAGTVLLTYQGDWGVLDVGENLPPNPSSEQLTEYVKDMPEAQGIWKDFLEFAAQLAEDVHAPVWACCLEICLRTFEMEKQLRLHAHLYLKNEDQQIRCEDQNKLSFMASTPNLKQKLWGRVVSRSNWAGAYYCVSPKLGSVFQHSTHERFRDFPVDPSWIFNMVEAGKILYADAKSELVRCGKGLVRRLSDLECWHQNKQAMLVTEMVQAAQINSRSKLQPFPRWPAVDAWLAEVTKPLQTRKKCLVLHGPSRTGKTEFVRGLYSLGAVLELNCSNLKDICLDGFDCLKHRAILWDEASAGLVSNNRKVFQHPLCEVDLGHSPTGQHVWRYFLGNCCSIITTNKWHEDVEKLPEGDQLWLQANTIVMNVEQPLWEHPDQLERCQQAFSALKL